MKAITIQVWMEALRLQLKQRGENLPPELHFLNIKGEWRWSVLARGCHESVGATPEAALENFTNWLGNWKQEYMPGFSSDIKYNTTERFTIPIDAHPIITNGT